MSNLYQDAILDAKALRASAMANAKAALEEAFEPKIQEMISKHLSEEAVEEDLEETYDAKEEGYKEEGKMHDKDHDEKMEEVDINEAELEEILNQLEEMSKPEVDESLNEAEEEEEEEETEEEEEGEAEEGEAATPDEDTKVVELTVGELMKIVDAARAKQTDAMADEMPGEEMPTPDSEAEEAAGEEMSLDEILDELENESIASDVHATSGTAGDTLPGDMEESALNEKKHKKHDAEEEMKEEMDHKKELEEAKATIETLRKDLQEVNLLNAKYLYMNKLFKSKSLTESQKLKVINTLDRATTVKEVKNAYQIMSESFEIKKGQLKESVGFASKPAGVAPKANIVESEQFINRWQKLAGIKK